ncbi:hypothetical protein [Leucobacter chromiiresistens]|uniref:hypothetical protein n=1 Tax=Leucobacter chromiiresistens TaxID=1079994 RepID=UPI000A5367DC|nr:hypothetical protein [Leucobacter chromiiresistens]
MTIVHARSSWRALGVVASVSAVIPLCLAGCAPAVEHDANAAELRAAPDSNLMTVPVDRTYAVTDFTLNAPLGSSALHEALGERISSSGTMVVRDGMIMSAELQVAIADMPEASFVQTTPTMLVRDDMEETVTSVGTLSVGDLSQPNTSVELRPTELGEDQAQFDVTFAVPDNLLVSNAGLPFDEVSAHLVLTAQ